MADVGMREGLVFAVLIAGVVWIGLYPRPVLATFQPSLDTLLDHRVPPLGEVGKTTSSFDMSSMPDAGGGR
jgi:NADH:ubiquinone oxidoreductase subunit 4 (subunit M)